MVAKIITGSSLYGLLSYNEEKIKENKAKLIADRGIIKDLSDVDFSMSNTLWSFNDHLINNRRTKKPYVHISINPDPKDNISDEDLKDLP
ncbi:MAG: hypothetical protein LIO65_01025 [Odoribacter sp.]|nr:hypothetical protein [Odoribacter sp.]